jgi:uncharacterized membrane protein YcaP (DUF421 family)
VVAELINIVVRSLVSVVALFLLTRLMGKKQIAQLNFFDYVAGISIGSIAASFAVDDSISYAHGLFNLGIYALMPIVVSYWSLKSLPVRAWTGGVPTILIQEGKLVEANLRHARFHINDLLEECRLKGAFSISDVVFAVLETSGRVSVMLRAEREPVTRAEVGLAGQRQGLTADLIIDGRILPTHLSVVGRDEAWLIGELRRQGVVSPREVLLATLDPSGTLRIDLRNRDPRLMKVLD